MTRKMDLLFLFPVCLLFGLRYFNSILPGFPPPQEGCFITKSKSGFLPWNASWSLELKIWCGALSASYLVLWVSTKLLLRTVIWSVFQEWSRCRSGNELWGESALRQSPTFSSNVTKKQKTKPKTGNKILLWDLFTSSFTVRWSLHFLSLASSKQYSSR